MLPGGRCVIVGAFCSGPAGKSPHPFRKDTSSRVKKPVLLASVSILLWSFGSYLSRLISMKSQFILLCNVYAFALLTSLAYFAYKCRGRPRELLAGLQVRDLLIGPLGYFVYSVGLIQSFRAFDSASETTILNYTWPVFTVVFSGLLFHAQDERSRLFRFVEGVGITLGLGAVVILASRGSLANLDLLNYRGIAWGLLSGVSYGLYSAYSGTVTKERHGGFIISSIASSLFLMLLFSIQEIPLLPTFTLRDWVVTALQGALLSGVGYITWTMANRLAHERGINVAALASLMFFLPVLSLAVIAVFLKETKFLEGYFLVSLILLLAGSLVCQKAGEIAAQLHVWGKR